MENVKLNLIQIFTDLLSIFSGVLALNLKIKINLFFELLTTYCFIKTKILKTEINEKF